MIIEDMKHLALYPFFVIVITMKEVICIQGKRKKKNLKVAAYWRVSTKEESQQGSIESQALYYEQLIKENPDWI